MKIKFLFIGTIILFSIITNLVYAQSLDFKINQFTFEPTQNISINITVINPLNESLELRTILYAIWNPDFPTSLKMFEIEPLETKTVQAYKIEVEENFPRGEYVIIANLLSKDLSILSEKNLTFNVIETKLPITITLKVCKDELCAQKSKTFLKNENIYLSYESDVPNPTMVATLIFPDKKTQQITLPTSIKAEKIGTYTFRATASKEGYKTTEKSTQFGVIEREAKIKTTGGVGVVWWKALKEIETTYILIIVFIVTVISVTALSLRAKLKSLSKGV